MDPSASPSLDAGSSENGSLQAIGSRLTQLRAAKGWKQRELSRRSRIDPGRLSKIERGSVRTTVAELVRLSLALGTSLDELVFGASPSREWHRLRQELERTGGPQAADCATRVLRGLVLTFQRSDLVVLEADPSEGGVA